ncbi:MAG: hypothetical protein V2A62_03940 [Candidatus Woesearchaeota archaeon]
MTAKQIAWVDEESHYTDIIREILTDDGHAVDFYDNSHLGCEGLQVKLYDVIVTNALLAPDTRVGSNHRLEFGGLPTGVLDLVCRIRAEGPNRETPIVVFTSYGSLAPGKITPQLEEMVKSLKATGKTEVVSFSDVNYVQFTEEVLGKYLK